MHKKHFRKILFPLVGIVVVWLLIWGILLMRGLNQAGGATSGSGSLGKNISITVIDDKRCSTCMTQEIGAQLQQVPFLKDAKFSEKDFSENGVAQYLKKNQISELPAFVFSTKDIGDEGAIQPYLKPLPNGEFSLQVGSKFDPFAKRSDKWFLILDTQKLQELKKDSYIEGNPNAKVSWIEYSDIECPFCAKLHNSWTIEYIEGKYKDSINRVFQHFPLEFHKNALKAALILECAGAQWWSKSFYELAKKAYAAEKSDDKFLLGLVESMWLDRTKVEVCVDSKEFLPKIEQQTNLWKSTFGISGTPGSVLINNTTGEYETISWALPKEAFEKVIDRLLK